MLFIFNMARSVTHRPQSCKDAFEHSPAMWRILARTRWSVSGRP